MKTLLIVLSMMITNVAVAEKFAAICDGDKLVIFAGNSDTNKGVLLDILDGKLVRESWIDTGYRSNGTAHYWTMRTTTDTIIFRVSADQGHYRGEYFQIINKKSHLLKTVICKGQYL